MNELSIKELYKNQTLRTGGFYELCIQVSESSNEDIIKDYFKFFWNLKNVEGPFDEDFNQITSEFEYRLEGILNIEDKKIPFINFNIREENPIEKGSFWFDISFYITTLEKVYNLAPTNWDEQSNCPEPLLTFLKELMKKLYEIHPFKLALLDFEISGEYKFEELGNTDFVNWSNSKFYIGKEHYTNFPQSIIKYIETI